MIFFITIVLTNIVIAAVIIYFVKGFLKKSRNNTGYSSGAAMNYEQKAPQESAAPVQKPEKTVLDMPVEAESKPKEIQPASQEAIKGMDFMDVYRLPEGPEKTSYIMAFAEAGDAAAQYVLGEAYLFETNCVEMDFNKAKELLQKSAAQGNSNSMAELTIVFMELSCDVYDEARRKGEAETEYMPKRMELMNQAAYNLAKALSNYNKIALGIFEGRMKLTWNEGEVRELLLEKTEKAMQPLLEELKKEDEGYSNYVLGMLTMRGIGTPQDINQAKIYFERGAELGNYESKFELENPLFTMDDDE